MTTDFELSLKWAKVWPWSNHQLELACVQVKNREKHSCDWPLVSWGLANCVYLTYMPYHNVFSVGNLSFPLSFVLGFHLYFHFFFKSYARDHIRYDHEIDVQHMQKLDFYSKYWFCLRTEIFMHGVVLLFIAYTYSSCTRVELPIPDHDPIGNP